MVILLSWMVYNHCTVAFGRLKKERLEYGGDVEESDSASEDDHRSLGMETYLYQVNSVIFQIENVLA